MLADGFANSQQRSQQLDGIAAPLLLFIRTTALEKQIIRVQLSVAGAALLREILTMVSISPVDILFLPPGFASAVESPFAELI